MRSTLLRLFLVVTIVVALVAGGFPLIGLGLSWLTGESGPKTAPDAADGAEVIQPPPPKPQPHLTDWSTPAGSQPAYVQDGEGAPDHRVPISLELADEGVDAQGKWYQTLRVTVELYGALSYVSHAIYDSADHIDELFDLARRQNPKVVKPELIFVGMTFDVTVDPSTTYVIRETTTASDGTKTRRYYNGVVEKLYPEKASVVREVVTPPGDRTKGFQISGMDDGAVVVAPGQKLVVYQHVPSVGMRKTLERLYGSPSYAAMQDFLRQIDWARHQSLRAGDRFQIVVDLMQSYDDPRPVRGAWLVDDEAAKAKYAEIEKQRVDAGIHLAEVGPSFNRLLVGVYAPAMTAKDAARLLYGSEAHYDHLIDLAGLWPKPATPGDNEKPPLPPDYNPSLFGHPFSVKVDLADEFFVWQQNRDGANAQTEYVLINGTGVVETFPVARGAQGIQRVIAYPSGRSKVQYRPNGLTMTLMDGAVFVSQLFLERPIGIDATERRLNAKLQGLRERRLTQLPPIIWEWDPNAPRDLGRHPIELGWALGQEGRVIEATLAPESAVTPAESLLEAPAFVRVLLIGAAAGIIVTALIALLFRNTRGSPQSLWR